MDVDLKSASLLLAVEDKVDMSDSDDCLSDDEEISRDIQAKIKRKMEGLLDGEQGDRRQEEEDTEDYHKMKTIDYREYQVELLELAKKQNIIICLPTGSGKTYIALKLAEHILPEAIEKQQKIIFLANNVPLVNQQAKYFSQNLVCTSVKDDQVVRSITGDLNVDIWKQEQWDEVLKSCHILVVSTQILLDALTKTFIKWKQIALLILDECHHAQKNHPMAELMKNYGERLQKFGPAGLPRVLGLTATIIKGQSKAEQISKDITDIEELLCCRAVTHRNYEDVLRRGWTVFFARPYTIPPALEKNLIRVFFETGEVPPNFEVLYKSKDEEREEPSGKARHSTNTILQVRGYTSNYKIDDEVCAEINQLIELLEKLPKDFGTAEEISIIERINHPTLNSEDQIYNKHKGVPKMLKSVLADLLKTYTELGPYCCRLAATLKVIYMVKWIQELEAVDDSDDSGEDSMDGGIKDGGKITIVHLLELAKTVLFQFMNNLDKMMSKEANAGCKLQESKKQPPITPEAWKVRYCVSNKVTVLWDILMDKKPTENTPESEKLCGLIFCQRRITAQVMRWYLEAAAKQWPNDLGFIKPEVMIGHSTIVGDTELARFTAKRQSKIVHQFHQRELNLLVATQVVEEGLNVPACNLVVRLDTITSYPSFVQSLGRARKQGAICYALIDMDDESKERVKIQSYVKYNEKLSAALERNALHVGEDEDEETIVGRFATPIPPFNPSGDPNGPMITATDAISLVHRYCNSLSCDKIAALFPTAWKEETIMDDKRKYFKARVLLPIMSPVREAVEGDWMPDKTLAKRSAYLKCCMRLHQEGELTENLLPKGRSIDNLKCEFLDKLKEQYDEEKKTAHAKIGTRKRTQWYRKKIPEAISASSSKIEQDAPMSIYNIKIKLDNFRGDATFRCLYEFERYEKSFGIVTNANLQSIPKFTLKANYGTLEVSIRKCNAKEKKLSKDQIESLVHFQVYLRDAIYGARNSVLQPDPEHKILIAPLQKISPLERTMSGNEYEIDWQLIQCLLNLDEDEHLLSAPSEQSRKELQFFAKSYENAVLIPWYKDDVKEKPELLCTLSVTDLNARSDFDDTKKCRTFEEYFGTKYGVQLFHPEYPLIHCKPIAKQLNFLTKKVDSYEMRKDLTLKNMVRMVPELMNIHILPASSYVQGKFLPSILHRVYRLLLANELRLKVAQHFNWEVDEDVDWLEEISDSETDEDDCDDDDTGGDSLADVLSSMQVGGENEGLTPSKKQEEKKKRKRNIILLETLNPLTVDWSTILESHDSPERTRNAVRDTRYSMPEPPVYKSSVCDDLIAIDKVESYHFDQQVDFKMERGPKMETIMEAITLCNAQDSIDLETLEVIGDSFLKLVVSLHVFRQFPRWDEGKMTQMRMKLISNLHLYQLAKDHQLGELLSGSIFIPDKSWQPVGLKIADSIEEFVLSKGLDYGDLRSLPESVLQSSERLDEHLGELRTISRTKRLEDSVPHTTYTHSHFGDKNIADCMEALIGAYFVHGGIDGAFRIMEYLGMRGPKLDGSAVIYSRESTMEPVEPEPHIVNKPQKIIPLLHLLEETICYKFKNPWIAVEALTHPTFMGNRITYCYERLEYVGDAILDFLVTNYISKRTKITDPGEITDLRAALVNNVTFGSLAVKYGFHTLLKYDSEPLKQCIEQFVQYQEENDHKVSDPFKLLSDFECPTVREIEVPKVLGDVFESIAGAVFVDSGMSIDTVWKVFYRLMKKEMEEFSKNTPKSPLRELYEQYPGKVKFCKHSEEDNKANPKSKQHIQSKYQTVYLKLKIPGCDKFVRGIGSTIKQAKQAAAKYVVRKLKYPDERK